MPPTMVSKREVNPFIINESSESAPNHTVLTGFEFLLDFRKEAAKAKERVWGQAMAMYPSHPGQLFLETFRQAAGKGLDTRLNVDWFTFLAEDEGFPQGINAFIKPKQIMGMGARHAFLRDHTLETFAALNSGKREEDVDTDDISMLLRGERSENPNAVQVNLTNPPTRLQKLFPFTGRSHIKGYIVDQTAYIGGINIGEDSFRGIDFVVKYQDPEVVQALEYQFRQGDGINYDYRRDFANGDQLFVDGGQKGKSIILDKALEMVGNATKSVRAVSFFTTDGEFAKTLSESTERGIDVEVIRPEGQWGLSIFGALDVKNRVQMRIRRQHVPFFDTPQWIHAKLLIVDDKDVMFGSHNLMKSGVDAGTKEIAMRTQHREVVSGLIQLYSKIREGTLTEAA